MKRFVWFSTTEKTIFGNAFRKKLETRNWWQKALGRKYESGTFYQMDEVTLDQALKAFDTFISSSGNFSIETKQGCRIDFLYKKGATGVFLDTWHSDAIEDSYVSVADARRLVDFVFRNDSDEAIAEFIRGVKN